MFLPDINDIKMHINFPVPWRILLRDRVRKIQVREISIDKRVSTSFSMTSGHSSGSRAAAIGT
jgi:hypothetical protein